VKGEMRNMFNSTPLISYNITVTPDPNSPKDASASDRFIKGSSFGKGTRRRTTPSPRVLCDGIRF